MRFVPLTIRMRDRISEEAARELPPEVWALVMDAEATIELAEPTGGRWTGEFRFRVVGNEAWNALEAMIGEEGKPGP